MKKGLLLINLGTPDHADRRSVRRYLKEFLSDPRVITLPALFRYILVHFFILPFRSKQSSHAYQAVWTPQGSPLLCLTQKLCEEVQKHLKDSHQVALGMRYGNPSIASALEQLKGCDHITILPLYPQYASATTGSSLEKALGLLITQPFVPSIQVIHDFYQHPAFIRAQAAQIQPCIASHDFILFSYHGLPENHLKSNGCNQACKSACPANALNNCYRAQCFQTTRLIAQQLGLPPTKYATAFQSRLGKTEWIKPYLDTVLPELAHQNVKRLAITCPSFVVDCLETLEEIGLRAQKEWLQLGGAQLTLVPALNHTSGWVHAIFNIIHPEKFEKNQP